MTPIQEPDGRPEATLQTQKVNIKDKQNHNSGRIEGYKSIHKKQTIEKYSEIKTKVLRISYKLTIHVKEQNLPYNATGH